MSKRQRGGNKGDEEKFVDELFNHLLEDPQWILSFIATMVRDIGSNGNPAHHTIWAKMAMKIEEAEELSKKTYTEDTEFDDVEPDEE